MQYYVLKLNYKKKQYYGFKWGVEDYKKPL